MNEQTMRLSAVVIPTTLAVVSVGGCEARNTMLEKIDAPDIVNFSRREGSPSFAGSLVGFGGATQPGAMAWLKDQGFATVINLRLGSEQGVNLEEISEAAAAAGLNYIHLPFDSFDPGDVVVQFLAAAEDAENAPIYVYCNSATRVGALWIIGRVLEDDRELDAAIEEVDVIAGKPDDAIRFARAYIAAHGDQDGKH